MSRNDPCAAPATILVLLLAACGVPDPGMEDGDRTGGDVYTEEGASLDRPPERIEGTPSLPRQVRVIPEGSITIDVVCTVPLDQGDGLYNFGERRWEDVLASTGEPRSDDESIATATLHPSGRAIDVSGQRAGSTRVLLYTACGITAIRVEVVAVDRYAGGVCESGLRCSESLVTEPALDHFRVDIWYGPVDTHGNPVPGGATTDWTVLHSPEWELWWSPGRMHAHVEGKVRGRDVHIINDQGMRITVPHISPSQVTLLMCMTHDPCEGDPEVRCILPLPSAGDADHIGRTVDGSGVWPFRGDEAYSAIAVQPEGCIRTPDDTVEGVFVHSHNAILGPLPELLEPATVDPPERAEIVIFPHDVSDFFRGRFNLHLQEPGPLEITLAWDDREFIFPIEVIRP